MTAQIHYVTGDATEPQGEGLKIIAHICNDIGAWGAGFVLALSAKWPEPETRYRRWAKQGKPSFRLGEVQFVDVENDIFVANMVAQHGVHRTSPFLASRMVNYGALTHCLHEVGRNTCLRFDGYAPSVHMPRIGTGLGGGDWTVIEELIQFFLCDTWDLNVTVYDLPAKEGK